MLRKEIYHVGVFETVVSDRLARHHDPSASPKTFPARSLITSCAWVCCERLDAQVRRQSSGCADTHRLSCALIVMIC